MFFSAAKNSDGLLRRTLGIARTRNLDAAWTPDPQPILPPAEQIENSSLYFEPAHHTWFLFCNHVGLENNAEFTDAVWSLLEQGFEPLACRRQGRGARREQLPLEPKMHRSALCPQSRPAPRSFLRRPRRRKHQPHAPRRRPGVARFAPDAA